MSAGRASTEAPVIWEDDKVIVRGRWRNGDFEIYVHRKDDGKEMRPLAYWLGSNALSLQPRRGA